MTSIGQSRILVWGWPVRLFHWGTVALMPALWWTWKQGEMAWHIRLGLVFLALLLFRVIWGFVGSHTARFSAFVRGPAAVLQFLRGNNDGNQTTQVGHNPLGALSVVAMILLLGAQIGLGLIAQDTDGLESGPLSYLVEYDTADWARDWHEMIFNLLLGLIGLHLAAIAYYSVIKKDRIVPPMITGKRSYTEIVQQPRTVGSVAALLALIIAGLIAWWVSKGAPLP